MARDEIAERVLIELSRLQRETLGDLFPVVAKTERKDGPETPRELQAA